jgi:methylmalonyl-CoA/ethylmalonyl-CoA epimerase
MPKLRHLAFHTHDVEATAEFYKKVFEMQEVGRTNSPLATGVYLSDGDLNVAILNFKTAAAADRDDGLGPIFGLHHFGFWVEDIQQVRDRLAAAGATHRVNREASATTAFFEEKWKGPDGVMIDIAEHGWAGAKPPGLDH